MSTKAALEREEVWSVARRRGYPAALALLDTRLASEPDNPTLLAHRASLLTNANRAGEAWQLLETLFVQHPDVVEVHLAAGYVRLLQKNYADAVTHLQRALVLDPTSWRAAHNLAIALKAQHDAGTAGEVLDAALRHHPDRAELLELRAGVAATLDDHQGATQWWGRAFRAHRTPDGIRSWAASASKHSLWARLWHWVYSEFAMVLNGFYTSPYRD